MLRLGSVVMNVDDVPKAVDFWCAALNYRPREAIEPGWAVLVPRSGTGPNVSLNLGTTTPSNPPHVHLDLYAGDAADQQAEVERLQLLGASRVDWPHYEPDSDYLVMADPSGNIFCVIDTGGG